MLNPSFVLYSDGGARGNPGPAALGYLIITGDGTKIVQQGSRYLGVATNNEAEYQAVIEALTKLKAIEKSRNARLVFYLDSLLVVNQLMGRYKVKQAHLQLLHQHVVSLIEDQEWQIEFIHIPRSNNAQADSLVNQCLDAHASSNKYH